MNKLNKIICGDSLKIMKDIPDKSIDLILTDPPYGIKLDTDYTKKGKTKTKYDKIEGDDKDIDFSDLFRIGKVVVIFGANNFYWKLPQFKEFGWIVWDKRNELSDKAFGSPFEIAFINKKNFYRFYRILHGGFINADKGERFHPTQKPVRLFSKIITDLTKEGDTILDPFLGSGTTAVACQNLKRNFIGIEISKEYCAIAEERLRQKPLL